MHGHISKEIKKNNNDALKISDSANSRINLINVDTTEIIFITDDSYIHGRENIFSQNKIALKNKALKKITTRLPKIKQKKIYRNKNIKIAAAPKAQILNPFFRYFFSRNHLENKKITRTSGILKILFFRDDYKKNIFSSQKTKNDNFFTNPRIKIKTIINLSDRAPPLCLLFK